MHTTRPERKTKAARSNIKTNQPTSTPMFLYTHVSVHPCSFTLMFLYTHVPVHPCPITHVIPPLHVAPSSTSTSILVTRAEGSWELGCKSRGVQSSSQKGPQWVDNEPGAERALWKAEMGWPNSGCLPHVSPSISPSSNVSSLHILKALLPLPVVVNLVGRLTLFSCVPAIILRPPSPTLQCCVFFPHPQSLLLFQAFQFLLGEQLNPKNVLYFKRGDVSCMIVNIVNNKSMPFYQCYWNKTPHLENWNKIPCR